MTRRPFSRFLRWFGGLLTSYFVIAAVLSTTVDPWRINGAPWAVEALDGAREISKTRRVGKAALANRGHWQVVILGSSRIEIGMDPAHKVFHGLAAVNLAMTGASLYENIAIGNYTLARNPQVKTLIFGIDPGDIHSEADSRAYNQYYQSPFADNNHSIERSINQLVGWRALSESIATLQRYRNGSTPKFNRYGLMVQPDQRENLRKFIESAAIDSYADQWGMRPQVLCRKKADLLVGFIQRVRRSGIEMHIIIPPQHALKQIHPTADSPQVMAWESDLLALIALCGTANAGAATAPPVKLWTFLTFNPFTTTPLPGPAAKCQQMPGWYDLGHSDTVLGNQVLDTLFADQAGAAIPVGVSLLDTDWNTFRASWLEGHRDYCASHPEDAAWWRRLINRSAVNAK